MGQLYKFNQNGKVISREKSNLPTPSLPQKFNTLGKGCDLAKSFLPSDAPGHLQLLTSNNSCKIGQISCFLVIGLSLGPIRLSSPAKSF